MKIYAVVTKWNGAALVEVSRKEIGSARLDEHVASIRKYNELKKNLLEKVGGGAIMVAADGTVDDFGGYPAWHPVRFVENNKFVPKQKSTWGGKREGAGRKPPAEPKTIWHVRVTERELTALKTYLEELRKK